MSGTLIIHPIIVLKLKKNTMEPLMLKQRPSSSQSQDSSHILRSTFRDLFSQGGMREDHIENLATTKSGEDAFHDCYVEKLQTVSYTRIFSYVFFILIKL